MSTQPSLTSPASDEPLLSAFEKPTYEQWRALAEEQLGGAPFEKKLVTRTIEGIDLQPIYNEPDSADLGRGKELPGFADYLRGSLVMRDSNVPWHIAQELPYSTPSEFNTALLNDLMRGQTSVNLSLDTATMEGKDPDAAEIGEVGACGVSIAMLQDLEAALENVQLEVAPLQCWAGCGGLPLAAMLFALAKKRGQASSTLSGGVLMDPLSALARNGTLPVSLSGAFDEMAVLVRYNGSHAPGLMAAGVDSGPYADGGGNAVEELAFALATGVEYLRQMAERKLSAGQVAPLMQFTFHTGPAFFMEVAKLRAARALWSRILRACGVAEAQAKMKIHARTGLFDKTVYDPYVNMLRTTTEAFAAALGGCDSMHAGPFDEVFRVPDEFSRRIARNTQVILQEECDLQHVIDPGGGSYYIERLTEEVCEKAWALFQEVEAQGGMIKALESGFAQERIIATRDERAKRQAQRRDVQVGTNMYANAAESAPERRVPDYSEIHRIRSLEIANYRVSNDSATDESILNTLGEVMNHTAEDVVESLIAAATAGASLGEITRALRANESSAPEMRPIPFRRVSQQYEELRRKVSEYHYRTGGEVKVYLANIGPLKTHKIRADFSRAFFEPAGVRIVYAKGQDTAEAIADGILDSGAGVAILCGTDDDYPEMVPKVCSMVREQSQEPILLLAGHPGDHEQAYKDAGLDDYIFIKSNNHAVLKNCLQRMGVL